MLHEIKEQQEAKGNKGPHNDPIPPLLRRDPSYETIQTRDLRCSPRNPPVDTRQRFPLQPETLIHGIRLAEHPVCHIVTIVYPTPFIQHVIRLRRLGVTGAVGIDIAPDVGEQVDAVARVLDLGP